MRRVLGYTKVMEELKKGNCIRSAPMSDNDYMIIDNEVCTVRNDFFDKARKSGVQFRHSSIERFISAYYLKEVTA